MSRRETLQILVSAGIKTREEARAELGLGGNGAAGLGKFNPHHDERGRFSTADNAAGATVGHPARKPRPKSVQVASNDAVMSDLGGDVAQIIEPEPPPPIEPPEAPRPMESAPSTSTEPLPELIAPSGKLPGTAEKLDDPRAMEA